MKLGHIATIPVAGLLGLLSLVSTQAMTGRESALGVFAGFVVSWFVYYGVAGAIPYGWPTRRAGAFTAAFFCYGAGGAAGGLLVAGLLLTHNLGGSQRAVVAASAIPFSVPPLIGWMLMRAVVSATQDDPLGGSGRS